MKKIGCIILGAVFGFTLVAVFQGEIAPLMAGLILALSAGSFMIGLP